MPMTATARFALSNDDLQALFALAGRSDTAAYGLADDLEASLGGFLVVARGGGAGLPPAIDADLVAISGQAAQLRCRPTSRCCSTCTCSARAPSAASRATSKRSPRRWRTWWR
jgi:hypothetical protein